MAAAADCPSIYDLVIAVPGGNTTGFMLDDAIESSLPFRTHKATYTYTPTFLERTNVSGDYGDNQQDFFMTATQRDWSLGEQQRYWRGTKDDDSARRYWIGESVDVTTPGAVKMQRGLVNITFGSAPVSCASGQVANFASATNLFQVRTDGIIDDRGAHGLGRAPDRYAMCCDVDGQGVLISSTGGGSVGIRRWIGAFSTFSATLCSALAVLNNALYGIDNNGNLVRFDTSGTATTLFTWKLVSGAGLAVVTKLIPFGGKLLIARFLQGAAAPCELWLYDGVAPALIARFPANFIAEDVIVSLGTIFVSGRENRRSTIRAAIYYYANGTTGKIWRSDSSISAPGLTEFDGKVVWDEVGTSRLLNYDPVVGGVNSFAKPTPSGTTALLASSAVGGLVYTLSATGGFSFEDATAATTATVTSSLFDFDSSLDKLMRSIRIDFDAATDGDGGSVDIAYRLNDVDGGYTSLATNVASGVEVALPAATIGRSISVKVTLNKSTSTSGPVLKRVAVRAAPVLTRFRQREYNLNCAGNPADASQRLRDGGVHPLSGHKLVDELQSAAASETPLTITDRFGTYTGVIEQLQVYEQHANLGDPSKSGDFIAQVTAREV